MTASYEQNAHGMLRQNANVNASYEQNANVNVSCKKKTLVSLQEKEVLFFTFRKFFHPFVSGKSFE